MEKIDYRQLSSKRKKNQKITGKDAKSVLYPWKHNLFKMFIELKIESKILHCCITNKNLFHTRCHS